MATTENTLSGINGSKKAFDFTFPYLNQSDLKVKLIHSTAGEKTLDGGVSADFTFATATQISLTAISGTTSWQTATGAPQSGVTGVVYRDTNIDQLAATFYPGSAIRSGDLNENYNQNLYVTQETENDTRLALDNSRTLDAGVYKSAISIATVAQATADAALDKANIAYASSDAAITDSASAVATANAASAAVADAVPFTLVANKAALISESPTVGDTYEITDTTNIQNSTGGTITWVDSGGSGTTLPTGVDWGPGITAKVEYKGTTEKWRFMSYWNNDPENNYAKTSDALFSGGITFRRGAATNDSIFDINTQDLPINYRWPNLKPAANDVLAAPLVSGNFATLDWVSSVATATDATNSSHVLVTDNESTNENNLITFVEDAQTATGNRGLEMDGNFHYNPSTGKVTATKFAGTLEGTADSALSAIKIAVTDNESTNEDNSIVFAADGGTNTGAVALEFDGDLNYNPSTGILKSPKITTSSDVVVGGNLQVDGTTTSVNSTTLTVDDKNIELAHSPSGSEGNDSAVDGGGLTIKSSDSDKEWKWLNANDAWHSSEHIEIASGKNFIVNGNNVLSQTALGSTVLASSLTSVGTLAGLDLAGRLSEAVTVTAGKLSDNLNLDLENGNIFYFTTQESAQSTPNLRYNSGTALNTKLARYDVLSLTIIVTAGDTNGFSPQLTIDGTAMTEHWVGGDAPSAGGSSGFDIYTWTIMRTGAGTAASDYVCFGNVTNAG